MESDNDRPQADHQESADKNNVPQASDRVSSTSDTTSSIAPTTQNVQGDRNQVIAHMSDSIAIANVETLNQITQNLPRTPESARYSLPRDAADFTGRESEIQQIEIDLSAEWVVAIAGMPGVGKSALAVRVAHRLKKQFGEGQIYLNLRGTDTQPLTVESALESLLRALGVDPAQIPAEQADKVALYRSHIAQTPTLVLLDNASDIYQVEELLPGAGACLVTSRRQLDGLAGVKHFNLEALPEAQALVLLQKVLLPERIQAEIDAAQQIVKHCGRLPLALRIAAATLTMRSWQGKRLADYAQQLADQRQRLDQLKLENLDIRASFELSYRELDPASAHLLGWLGLLPGDFGTDILIPLTEEPAELVQTALAALVDGRLVDPLMIAAPGERYILHDLMRLFALEKLETQAELVAVQSAKVRLVQWCGEQADTWENALNPKRRRQWAEVLAENWATEETENLGISAADLEPRLLQSALIWFEAKREILVQAFTWATETQQWQASVALAANLASFFTLRGYWGDWVSTHRQALTAAQQADDPQGEGQTLNNLGLVYQSQGKWSEAIACYEQALQIKRAIEDVQGEGQTLNNLGLVYEPQGKWSEAIECYEQALQTFRTLGHVHGEGASLNNLSSVYQSQGKWSEAIECYEQALQTFRTIGDVHGEGASLNNLGSVYQSQGKWSEAIECYEQALQTFRAIGDVHGEGKSFNNFGLVYDSQGKWSEAIECYEQALQTFRTIGDVQGEGQTLNNFGLVYDSQEKWSEAIECYEQALQTFRTIGDVQGEGQTLNNFGSVYDSQEKWSEAIECYEQSLQIKRAIGDVHGEGRSLMNLGTLQQKQGRLIQASEYWQDALTKLHPDSPEYRQLYTMLHPNRRIILSAIGMLLLGAIALTFVVSNLLAGRWLVALVILFVTITAWFMLKAIQRRG
ncbi:tetratricopeptide repeat protein [Trichocoleus desertorum AS-A10]|uniref:tetratricopeptide repeat protein n=1 Tax=Trichocoleus desertorum TaxID=1481672 RepID=UPI00329A3CB4